MSASIPNVVDDKNLMKLNSMHASIGSLASLVSPVIGGILFKLIGFEMFLLFNSISFFISALTEVFMNFGYASVVILLARLTQPFDVKTTISIHHTLALTTKNSCKLVLKIRQKS